MSTVTGNEPRQSDFITHREPVLLRGSVRKIVLSISFKDVKDKEVRRDSMVCLPEIHYTLCKSARNYCIVHYCFLGREKRREASRDNSICGKHQ